ncbi:MAG: hypothetical protein ABIF77_20005, partial [bacterium]
MRSLVTLILLCLVGIVPTALAGVPQTISFQGVLDDTGNPPLNGSYLCSFSLWDAETGGDPELWWEDILVNFDNGVFSVILGQTEMFYLPFDQQYWLQVGVDGVGDFPRIPLTTSPYSFCADQALAVASGGAVLSLNELTDHVALKAGDNVTIQEIPGDTLLISATALATGSSLDDAYDAGGSGAGRTIAVDAEGVVLDATDNLSRPALILRGDELYEPGLELDNGTQTWRVHVDGDNNQFGVTKFSGGAVTPLRINNNALNNSLVLTSGGVGIYTNDPNEMLQVVGAVNIGNTTDSNAGTIRWTGTDFEGCFGPTWKSLTAVGSGADTDWIITGDDMSANVTGSVRVGSADTDARLQVAADGTKAGIISMTSKATDGGALSAAVAGINTATEGTGGPGVYAESGIYHAIVGTNTNAYASIYGLNLGSGAAIKAENQSTGPAFQGYSDGGDILQLYDLDPVDLRFSVSNAGDVNAAGNLSVGGFTMASGAAAD